jgi:hypothetical protein
MESFNVVERPKRLGLGGGVSMPHLDKTIPGSCPIIFEYRVINYITLVRS